MACKTSGNCSTAPLFLRIGLGLLFLWAGLGKVMATFDATSDQAAELANMGVFIDKPLKPKPTAIHTPNARPYDQGDIFITLVQSGGTSPASRHYTAADFPDPVKVLRVNQLALTIAHAGNPAPLPDGTTPPASWPATFSRGFWPVGLAWAAAITEIVAGTCLLLGFITRVSALGVFLVMLGAMWLTEIGPAVMSGQTQLGFLPKRDTFDAGWRNLWYQFIIACSAFSLLFSGSGAFGVDRALFGTATRTSRPAPADEEKSKA